MSDWEKWDDDNKEIEDNKDEKKFEDEAAVDADKEKREAEERAKQRKALKEEELKIQEEKKANEVDYEALYKKRTGGDEEDKSEKLSEAELKKKHPTATDAQIREMMSREAEASIVDGIFTEDSTPKGNTKEKKSPFSVDTLKGEKAYKNFGKEVGTFISTSGESHNHIPKLLGSLFHELSEKVSIIKMRQIVKDFDERLKIKEKEEQDKKDATNKVEKKKSKNNKKKAVGGVSKGLGTNTQLLNDVFEGAYDDNGEGDYYEGEGDAYVDYGRDDIDFM